VLSAMCVSFVHGSNDGQKGIGLIMLVLISIVPAKYVLDPASTPYQVQRTVDAVAHLSEFYQRKADTLGDFLALHRPPSLDPLQTSHCKPRDALDTIQTARGTLIGVHTYDDLRLVSRVRVPRYMHWLNETARKGASMDSLSLGEKTDLRRLRGDL